MPSATNMSVKDRQKTIAGPSTCETLWRPSRMSVTLTPDTADR